jgi:hypothetical protein
VHVAIARWHSCETVGSSGGTGDGEEPLSRKASIHVGLGVADGTAALAFEEVFTFLAMLPHPLMSGELADHLREFHTHECSPMEALCHGADDVGFAARRRARIVVGDSSTAK